MALNSSGSKIALALVDETVVILNSKTLKEAFTFKEKCVTSMCFQNDALVYTTGSQNFSTTQWQHDLLSNGASGTVSANQLDGSKTKVILTGTCLANWSNIHCGLNFLHFRVVEAPYYFS